MITLKEALLLLMILVVGAWTIYMSEVEAADDYFYTSIFMGTTSGDWEDSGKMSTGLSLGYARRIHKNFWMMGEYEHKSQLMAGQPLNDLPESSTNSLNVVFEWRWGE